MPLIDPLFSFAPLRRAIWAHWYPFVTRRLRDDGVIFLNYGFETDPPWGLRLDAADEANRACIQLYHHVATPADLRGKHVLEISCGHGGGASYLTRTRAPAYYAALDLNPTGIAFCRARHRVDGLTFVQGDAENLPFAEATFDAVINVEASHCYPSLDRFFAEVARVLRPGGHFLYADFRFESYLPAWEKALAAAPLRLQAMRVINAGVLRGMKLNSARSAELIARHLPRWVQSLGRDFAGVEGSRIYNALEKNELSYRSYHFTKPGAAV